MIVVVGWFRLLTLLHELDQNMIAVVKNKMDQTPLKASTNGLVRLCLCLFFCVDTFNTSTNRLVLCLCLLFYVDDTSNTSTRRMCIGQDHSLSPFRWGRRVDAIMFGSKGTAAAALATHAFYMSKCCTSPLHLIGFGTDLSQGFLTSTAPSFLSMSGSWYSTRYKTIPLTKMRAQR